MRKVNVICINPFLALLRSFHFPYQIIRKEKMKSSKIKSSDPTVRNPQKTKNTNKSLLKHRPTQ